ncbi:hypothetical protein ONZ51_g5104 [Trametes cubensis]|uniref:Uncharacterized protein n=1 Tax=Trametes cubensis TaxID=1111947 RepID=A0AAD7XDZ8_9APHY|nr:hypothetical protein ONZ51_g5104 [Trametes cubensis]
MIAVTTPNSEEQYVDLLTTLLNGFQSSGAAEEPTDEEIAKYLLEADNEGAYAELTGHQQKRFQTSQISDIINRLQTLSEDLHFADGAHIVETEFFQHNNLEITKGSGRNKRLFFDGTSVDSWRRKANGILVQSEHLYGCKFVAIDGFQPVKYPALKLMIIFFYASGDRKYSVFVGKSASTGGINFTKGHGIFYNIWT